MKRKHKTYSKPKRPFDKVRIEEEGRIKKEFGLKNKKEIWKAEAKINSIREKAKKLIGAPEEEQKSLFDRLNKIGIEVKSIGDILSLEKEDYLKRRLQTITYNKKIAKSIKEARQLIAHRKILVGGKAVSAPSYIVSIELENKITKKQEKPKKQKEETTTEENKSKEKTE